MGNKQNGKYLKKRTAAGWKTAFSSVLTIFLILVIAARGNGGNTVSQSANMEVADRFYMNAANAVSDLESSLRTDLLPQDNQAPAVNEDPPAETTAPGNSEKKYWISSSAVKAPKPDRDAFGRTGNPEDLTDVIASASNLLDGQSLYFTPEITLMPDSEIRYYLDDTILAITWKQVIDNTVYTFSEIKIADPSQFRRYLAGGEYGSGKLAVPTELADTVNAVVASSGDYYQFRNAGVIVYNGQVCRVNEGADTCYITQNGDLLFTKIGTSMTMEQAQNFVEENGIQFSVAFGPILVENGEKHQFGYYGLGEVGDTFARAALCQMGELHYLLVNANAEGNYHSYPTMYTFANRIYETGCLMGYALDGGQTAVIVMDGELINRVTFGHQRKISDIIYFATAVPEVD